MVLDYFPYAGRVFDDLGNPIVPSSDVVVTTDISAQNGGDIESVDSIKVFCTSNLLPHSTVQ